MNIFFRVQHLCYPILGIFAKSASLSPQKSSCFFFSPRRRGGKVLYYGGAADCPPYKRGLCMPGKISLLENGPLRGEETTPRLFVGDPSPLSTRVFGLKSSSLGRFWKRMVSPIATLLRPNGGLPFGD